MAGTYKDNTDLYGGRRRVVWVGAPSPTQLLWELRTRPAMALVSTHAWDGPIRQDIF